MTMKFRLLSQESLRNPGEYFATSECEVAQLWVDGDNGHAWWTNGGPTAGTEMPDWLAATHWMPIPNWPRE